MSRSKVRTISIIECGYELFIGSALKLSRTPDSLPRLRFLRWPKIKTEINVVARVGGSGHITCRCRVERKRGSVERVNYGESSRESQQAG